MGHLVGILTDSDPRCYGIEEVHLWSHRRLLEAVPDQPWLRKHNPPALELSLPPQICWQYRDLPKEAKRLDCNVLLNTDAGSVCRFFPSVVMSRDMLSYEPGEMQRYSFGRARLRLEILRWVQNRSMRNANGVIFLTKYASSVIQKHTGPLPFTVVIPHGVGQAFKCVGELRNDQQFVAPPRRLLYVSNAAPYKHQWHVVRAIAELRNHGHNVVLELVGGGSGDAKRRLENEVQRSDPRTEFVTCRGFVPAQELPTILRQADIFIFASSCENMPNTLVEAMASGLPIACSNRGPMPEVLGDGGLFFDPEDSASIAQAVRRLLENPALRSHYAKKARELAGRYSWERCGSETWEFLKATTNRFA